MAIKYITIGKALLITGIVATLFWLSIWFARNLLFVDSFPVSIFELLWKEKLYAAISYVGFLGSFILSLTAPTRKIAIFEGSLIAALAIAGILSRHVFDWHKSLIIIFLLVISLHSVNILLSWRQRNLNARSRTP